MAKQAAMASRVTESLASLIESEIHHPCPAEGMSLWLQDIDGTLTRSEVVDDCLQLTVRRKDKNYVLTLKPVGWAELKPKRENDV